MSSQSDAVHASPPLASSLPSEEFHAIYRAEFHYVLNSLRRLGVAERDLEDVVHDAFVAVYRRLGDYDRARPVRPWLFGFAYRLASDHRRLSRHRHEVSGIAIESAADGCLPADEQLAREQTRLRVLAALETLEFERRGVLVMHDLDGHSVPDIARALSIPLNTAYSRLRLARKDFEAAIRRATTHEAVRKPPGGAS